MRRASSMFGKLKGRKFNDSIRDDGASANTAVSRVPSFKTLFERNVTIRRPRARGTNLDRVTHFFTRGGGPYVKLPAPREPTPDEFEDMVRKSSASPLPSPTSTTFKHVEESSGEESDDDQEHQSENSEMVPESEEAETDYESVKSLSLGLEMTSTRDTGLILLISPPTPSRQVQRRAGAEYHEHDAPIPSPRQAAPREYPRPDFQWDNGAITLGLMLAGLLIIWYSFQEGMTWLPEDYDQACRRLARRATAVKTYLKCTWNTVPYWPQILNSRFKLFLMYLGQLVGEWAQPSWRVLGKDLVESPLSVTSNLQRST